MTIGMIVAMPEELESFLSGIGTAEKTENIPGYEVRSYKINNDHIVIVGSGVGEIAAAASTQMLITRYHADMIVNFGVVGGLTPEMTLSKVVVIDRLVHYDYDASPFYDGLVPGQYPGMESIYFYPDRRLLELRYYQELTQLKTAEVLGMTQVQVSRREKKLLLYLRQELLQ